MDSYLIALGSALWLGILTSLSPCPLATNVAAIAYVARRVDKPAAVLMSGLAYTIGRMITYVVIGALVVGSVLSIPDLALFLQRNMNRMLGPFLIVAGLFLLDVLKLKMTGVSWSQKLSSRAESLGTWGAGALGLLFALSFCPVSAALFFGGLIPLAVDQQSSLAMPTVFAVGTALPVVLFAILIATGARMVGVVFDKIKAVEVWARRTTAVALILVGGYYVLIYIFGVPM